jgi:hypothetical protein
MSIFEYVTVAISIIIGLALSRLLSAGIDLFRHRAQIRSIGIPIVWAIDIFWLMIVLWWQIFGISQLVTEWVVIDFFLGISLVVALFVASSLVLPKNYTGEDVDLYDYYSADGRWGVAAYTIFFLIVVPFNFRLFGSPVISIPTLWIVVLVGTSFGAFLNRSKRQAWVLTLVFVTVHICNIAYVLFPRFGG